MLRIDNRAAVLVASAVTGLLLIGCAAADAPPSSQDIEERVVTASPRMATGSGASVGIMVASHATVVLGTVTGATDITNLQEHGYPAAAGSPPLGETWPRHDPANDPPQVSRYEVDVLEVLAGSISGRPMQVMQAGGIHCGTAYEWEGDHVIEVGKTYLFFLDHDAQYGWYTSVPWGRFEVVADVLESANPEWSLPVAEELDGLGLKEAREVIAEAVASVAALAAEGKLPVAPPAGTQPRAGVR